MRNISNSLVTSSFSRRTLLHVRVVRYCSNKTPILHEPQIEYYCFFVKEICWTSRESTHFFRIGTVCFYNSILCSAQSLWLRTGRPGFDSGQGQEVFLLLHSVETGFRAHAASYPVGTRAKAAGHEADSSPPSAAKVKNGGAIPPLPDTSFWCGA
jgi:hypothetical protein